MRPTPGSAVRAPRASSTGASRSQERSRSSGSARRSPGCAATSGRAGRRAGSPPRPPPRARRGRPPRTGSALAQAQEGDVAVAVVRRLREDGQDELAERVAVGRHDRHAVDVAQALAHRADAARRRRGPGRRRRRGRHGRAAPGRGVTTAREDRVWPVPEPSERTATVGGQPVFWREADPPPGPAARPSSTSTASRRARTTGCPSCAARAAWRPTSRASAARASAGTATSRWPATSAFVEPFLDLAGRRPRPARRPRLGRGRPAVGPAPTASASSASSSSTPSPSSPATAGTAWRARGARAPWARS